MLPVGTMAPLALIGILGESLPTAKKPNVGLLKQKQSFPKKNGCFAIIMIERMITNGK
jgi:hypothetical protein